VGHFLPNRRPRIDLRPTIPASRPRSLTAATRDQLVRIVRTLEEHKAIDIVALDLRKVTDTTDVFIIASGSSDTHVRALAEHVADAVKAAGDRPNHVEGIEVGRWVLLDMVDCVVHVFHPELREYYQLERLWADAPSISVDSLA